MVKRAINPLPVMKNNDAIDPLKDLEIEEKKNDTQAAEPVIGEEESTSEEIQSEIPEPTPEEVKHETIEPSPEDAKQETSESSSEEVKQEITESSPEESQPEISKSSPEEIKQELSEPSSEEIQSEIPEPTPEEVKQETTEPTPEEVKQEITEPTSDEDVKQETHPKNEEERFNFSLLSKEDLVKLLKEKLDNPARGNIRKDVDEIRQVFFEKVSSQSEEKKKHFLEEGGNLEDFKPAEDPAEQEMKELLHKYRGLKAEFARQLEKSKQENLRKKQEILEQFRVLMEGLESFEVTFRSFKELQKQWFAAGVVPPQNLKDLWDSYNYFVEKFNDYVRINRDLRALDLKKNLELKEKLCERTEELETESNIVQAFKVLQKHHTQWREIGPVPRDNREEIWERFKQATSVINRKHQEYHSRLKESLHENLEKKADLCNKVEEIAAGKYDSHGAWVERTNLVLELQKTWKTIGYAPKKDNNAIYARFRKACDVFFSSKAAYYASAYEEQKENLRLKLEITEKAESLSSSEDWKDTTTQLIRLQKQWKEIGPVPRRDSDKLWRRFRAACDAFFQNKSKYFENIDSTFDENLKSKESLIKEMEAHTPTENSRESMKALDDFQSRFDEIGYVPSGKKDWIKEEFRQALDRLLEKVGLGESERSIYRFRNRVKGMAGAPRSEMKLSFERDKLANKLQLLKSDIGVWENNIGFFKQSDSSEETIQGFHEKIEIAHERIRVFEEKIRILDRMENAN